VIGSAAIGAFEVELAALCFNFGVDDWFTLYHGNSSAGKLRLRTEFKDHHTHHGDIEAEFAKMENKLNAFNHRLCTVDSVEQLIPFDLEKAFEAGDVKVSGSPANDNEGPENTVSGSLWNKCCGPAEEGQDFCLTFSFKKPVIIRGYGIRSANDFPVRDPLAWTLCAGENGEKPIDMKDG